MKKKQEYILANGIVIPKLEEVNEWLNDDNWRGDYEAHEIEKVYKGQAFLVGNLPRKRLYIVPQVIKVFLDCFKEIAEFDDVVDYFMKEAQCERDAIRPTMVKFMNQMLSNGFIIPAKDAVTQAEEDTPIFEIGHCFAEVKIVKMLNQKSDIEIYLAENLRTGKPLVVKTLRTRKFRNANKKKHEMHMFLQEFKLMADAGKHPNICELHAYKVQDDEAYAIIEYIDGKSPRSLAKRAENPLTLDQRLLIITQIFDAMAGVHHKNILHGDVHCSNFLVTDDFQVKLIDFGMSNHADLEKGEIAIRGGVSHYMPPEKLSNNSFSIAHSRADYRSEVFQLGVIAFIVLYGKKPFTGVTWNSLIHAIQTLDADFAEQSFSNENIPANLIAILKKAMQKDPARRYESAMTLSKVWQEEMKMIEVV